MFNQQAWARQSLQDIFHQKGLNHYIIGDLLGEGQFGFVQQFPISIQVFKVHDPQQKQYYAAKYLASAKLNDHNGLVRELALNEIKALNLVKNENCPYIVKLFAHYESKQKDIILLLEYCDSGDLDNLLRQRGRFSEADGVGIVKQIFSGLACLHKHFIIHRDMKAANILVHQNKIFKIADLGFCTIMENAQGTVHLPLGSLGTMAPEIIYRQRYGLQVDIFALGAIFYQIIHGRLPFNYDSQSAFINDIRKKDGKIQYETDPEGRVSTKCLELLSKMLRSSPEDRITFADLAQHPIFTKQTNEQFMYKGISLIQHQGNQLDMMAHQGFYIENSKNLQLSDGQSPTKKIRILHVADEAKQLPNFVNLFEWVYVEQNPNSESSPVNRLYNVFNALVYMERTLHEFSQINHKSVLEVVYPQLLLSKKLMLEAQYLVVELQIVKQKILTNQFASETQLDQLDQLMRELRERHINLYSTYFIRDVMDNPKAEKYAIEEWKQEVSERPTHQFERNYKDGILKMIASTLRIVDGLSDIQQQQLVKVLCFVIHLYKILDFTQLAQNPPNISEDFDFLPQKSIGFLKNLLSSLQTV